MRPLAKVNTRLTRFAAPQGVPPQAAMAGFTCVPKPISAHPSHGSWPHRELHRGPLWQGSPASASRLGWAHPSHGSSRLDGGGALSALKGLEKEPLSLPHSFSPLLFLLFFLLGGSKTPPAPPPLFSSCPQATGKTKPKNINKSKIEINAMFWENTDSEANPCETSLLLVVVAFVVVP